MKFKLVLMQLCVCLGNASLVFAQDVPEVPYLDQDPPGSVPQIFAPGRISLKGRFERVAAFSPDGREIFFNVTTADWSPTRIWHSVYENGKWSDPAVASFSKLTMNAEPFISPDGTKLFFTSNRTPGEGWNYDIWMIEQTDNEWSEAKRLSKEVNTSAGEWHPCVTANGNLYFAREGNVYVANFVGGAYQNATKVNEINSASNDWDPYVSPDETYIIFKSDRPGGYGGMDLYVSFKDRTNRWKSPINMGSTVNTPHHDDPGDITPDGKYMFFARRINDSEMDIYWVSADLIVKLHSDSMASDP